MLTELVGDRRPDLVDSTPSDHRELLLSSVEVMLEGNQRFGVAADFDQNLSHGGPSKGLDPRDSYIDPIARQALVDMRDAGIPVVIISSRGAKDVAEKVGIPGVSYVGTLGWETYVANEDDPAIGESKIHPQFRPFKDQITGILGDVRQKFLQEQLHLVPLEAETDPNLDFPTPDGGTVILQRKGFNEEYPEGINLTWALNLVSSEKREEYKKALQRYYEEAFTKHSGSLSDEDKAKLQELCGLKLRPGMSNEGMPTLDVEIRPTSQSAKAGAMLELLRTVDSPERTENFAHMPHAPFWVYSGDHIQQDGAVMHAGHLAYKLTHGQGGVIGVWSRPPHEEERPIPNFVDIVVDGVPGNAALLRDMAEVVKAQRTEQVIEDRRPEWIKSVQAEGTQMGILSVNGEDFQYTTIRAGLEGRLPYTVGFQAPDVYYVSEDAPYPVYVMTHEIRENTVFADLPESERCLAALQAELEDVVKEMPDGYQDYVKNRSAFFDALVRLYEDKEQRDKRTPEFIEAIEKSKAYLHSLIDQRTT